MCEETVRQSHVFPRHQRHAVWVVRSCDRTCRQILLLFFSPFLRRECKIDRKITSRLKVISRRQWPHNYPGNILLIGPIFGTIVKPDISDRSKTVLFHRRTYGNIVNDIILLYFYVASVTKSVKISSQL